MHANDTSGNFITGPQASTCIDAVCKRNSHCRKFVMHPSENISKQRIVANKPKLKPKDRLAHLKSLGSCLGLARMVSIALAVTKFLLLYKPMVGTSVFSGTAAFSRIFSVEGL